MKDYLKRSFALTMAGLFGMMAVSGMATPAFADELQVTDAYVLTYNGAVEGYEFGSLPYMY